MINQPESERDYDLNTPDDGYSSVRALGCVIWMLLIFLFVLIIGGFTLLASGAL